jgi:hypothetical protein
MTLLDGFETIGGTNYPPLDLKLELLERRRYTDRVTDWNIRDSNPTFILLLQNNQTFSLAHSIFYLTGTDDPFPWVQRLEGPLTFHLQLMPKVRISGSRPQFSLYALKQFKLGSFWYMFPSVM